MSVNCDVCGKELKNNTGLSAHKRFNHKEQEKEPEATEITIEEQHVLDAVSGKNVPTLEEGLALTTRQNGEAVTTGGIVIPAEVLARSARTNYRFVVKSLADKKVAVFKISPNGRDFFVREYSQNVHGEDFRELADQFCEKNNS